MTRQASQRRPARRGAILAIALALASTASAQLFNLNNFDPINTNSIPAACRAAYTSPLEGCRRSDFTGGNTCSASCVHSVDLLQDNIQASCSGVFVSIDTLLGQAMLGNLRQVLCPGAPDPPGTTLTTRRSTIQSPSPVVPPSTRPARPTTSLGGGGNNPTPTPQFSTIEDVTTTVRVTTIISSPAASTPAASLTTTVPVILSPSGVPAATGTVITPPNPPSDNNGGNNNNNNNVPAEQGGARSPGGNDVLNPIQGSASPVVLPRPEVAAAAAAALLSYLMW